MRAKFADLPDDESDSLESNIKKFKNDPENMQIMVDFINDVLKTAQEQAELKIKSQQDETCKPGGDGSVLINFKNGKIINRARGMVVRIFDVICNCANTAAAPAQRFTARRQEKN